MYSRRILLHTPFSGQPSGPSQPVSGATIVEGGSPGSNFDANIVMILAVLLCALICALGLNSIVRCALRCSSGWWWILSRVGSRGWLRAGWGGRPSDPCLSFSTQLGWSSILWVLCVQSASPTLRTGSMSGSSQSATMGSMSDALTGGSWRGRRAQHAGSPCLGHHRRPLAAPSPREARPSQRQLALCWRHLDLKVWLLHMIFRAFHCF